MASSIQTAPEQAQWLFGSNVVGFELSEMSGASETDLGGLGDCGPLENRRRKKRGEKPPSRSGGDSTGTSVQDRPLHQRFSDDTAFIPVGDLKRKTKKKPAFTFDESGGEETSGHVKETSLDFMESGDHGHNSASSKGVQQWTSLEMNTGCTNGDSESPAEEMEGTLSRKHQARSGHSKSKGEKKRSNQNGGSTSSRRDSTSGVTTADEGEDAVYGGSRKGTSNGGKSHRGRIGESETPSTGVRKKVSGASSSAFLSDDGGGSTNPQGRAGKPPMHWQASSTQELMDDGAFDTVSISSKSTRGRRNGHPAEDAAVPQKKKRSNSKDLTGGFNTSFNASKSTKRGESPFLAHGDVDDVSCSTSLMGTLKSKQTKKLGSGNSPGAQSIEFDHNNNGGPDSKGAGGGWTLASLGTLPPIQLSHGGQQAPPQSKHGRTPSSSSTLPFD